MDPVTVEEIRTSITMRGFFHESPEGPRVALLRIDDVRNKSAAERAGLVAGLKILAINGVDVEGLDPVGLDRLWRGPFPDPFIVMKVAPMPLHSGFATTAYDITIPLKSSSHAMPFISIRLGPKEPTPPTAKPEPQAPATPSPAPTAGKLPPPSPAPKAEKPPAAQG
jgi:membrane-associated protease RseP (regulator of RpoE activity)